MYALEVVTLIQVDLRSEFERSEDPDSLLVEDADLQVSKRQGNIAQAGLQYVALAAAVVKLETIEPLWLMHLVLHQQDTTVLH